MICENLKFNTPDGEVTIPRNMICAINPLKNGAEIHVEPSDPAEEQKVYITYEPYDTIVDLYLSA